MSDRRTPFVRLAAFFVVAAVAATYLAIVLGNLSFTGTHGYKAMFTSASGMKDGSPVRIAGVDVGRVTDVSIVNGHEAEIGFDLDDPFTLTSATTVAIRYKNLIGDRYLELARGAGTATELRAGSVIPASRTSPALDLDTLLDGFHPLFEGLAPEQINAVSNDIVQTLQGESGNVTTLLATIASLTSTLADRTTLVQQVISNLDTALSTVSAHGPQLSTLITQVQQLITGLAERRDPIGDAIDHVSDLTTSLTGLLSTVRPDLAADVTQIRTLATALNANSDQIVQSVQNLPTTLKLLTRIGAYGNFLNGYVCDITLRLSGTGSQDIPLAKNKTARCQNS